MVPPQEAPVPRVAAQRMIGKPVQRREDARLITGRGRYVDDVALPGMLHAAFVRSHSRARHDHATSTSAPPGSTPVWSPS